MDCLPAVTENLRSVGWSEKDTVLVPQESPALDQVSHDTPGW